MLQQEERVGQLPGLSLLTNMLLEGNGVEVGDGPKVAYP
jgi:hypothetical protein